MGLFSNKERPANVGADYVNAQNPPMAVAIPIPDNDIHYTPSAPPMDTAVGSAYENKAPAPTKAQIPEANVAPPPKQSMLGGPNFRRIPIQLTPCPLCLRTSRTRIRTYPNMMTWILVVVIFILFWPLCWIPLVMEKTKKTEHYCVSCNDKVGEVRPLEDCCETSRR